MYFKKIICGGMLALAFAATAQNNVAEEVAWVVGDTPIWKSEIEEQFQQLRYAQQEIKGDPYCFIPEQMAVQKLYLHQADLDTIEANEAQVVSGADRQLNMFIAELGSKEKVEQYFRKSIGELRQSYMDILRNESRVAQVQRELTKDIKTTPSDIRRYFNSLPADSVPYVPLQVEVQIITMEPVIPREEVEDVKDRLRRYADAVNNGESFSTLAILYSEDGSSVRGGELGFMSRAALDPEFAAVAFNLNDPKKVSRIVQSQYGYHIIQLIEKRGDRINCRHILLTPKVSDSELKLATERMDSLRNFIAEGKATFDEATQISMDKDTRNNRGLMVNNDPNGPRTSRFRMDQLPQEVAKNVADLQVGEMSKPFVMTDNSNKTIVAMVRLANRIEGHRADLRNDYLLIKDMYENAERERILAEWLEKKIRETYVRVEEGYRNCDFRYNGWIRERADNSQSE